MIPVVDLPGGDAELLEPPPVGSKHAVEHIDRLPVSTEVEEVGSNLLGQPPNVVEVGDQGQPAVDRCRCHQGDAERANLTQITEWFIFSFALVLLATLLARGLRLLAERRAGRIRISYVGGRRVVAPLGLSVLEVSRANGIPHASVCGGRGRCSTCRVLLEGDEGALEPPSEEEARVLQRIKAPSEVRLVAGTTASVAIE